MQHQELLVLKTHKKNAAEKIYIVEWNDEHQVRKRYYLPTSCVALVLVSNHWKPKIITQLVTPLELQSNSNSDDDPDDSENDAQSYCLEINGFAESSF